MAFRKTSKNNRAFKGVWIPAKYWLDPKLSIVEVAAIAEMDSLDNDEGCIASNKHFANFLGVTPGRASQIINGLKDKGYIIIDYDRNGKQIIKRHIRVVNKLSTPLFNKLNKGSKKIKGGYLENCEDSNTGNSNTTSNTNNGQARPDDTTSIRKQIIAYLNSKLGTSYKPNASKNKQVINARLHEGYTLDDFKKVIDNKTSDWGNDQKMSKYLRPETLFGTKMEGYVNEKPKASANTGYHGFADDSYFTDHTKVLDNVSNDDLPF